MPFHRAHGSSIEPTGREHYDRWETAHDACAAADGPAARCIAEDRQSGKSGNPEAAAPHLQVLRRIHGTQQVVAGNLPVECRHQTLKSLGTDNRIDLVLFHLFIVPGHLGNGSIFPVAHVVVLSTKGARVHAIHIKHAAQVIDLMLQNSGVPPGRLDRHRFRSFIEGVYANLPGARNDGGKPCET